VNRILAQAPLTAIPRRNDPLQQPLLHKREVAVSAQDNVIEYADTEELGGFDKADSNLAIILTGIGIA
jgi:hypothetical protein